MRGNKVIFIVFLIIIFLIFNSIIVNASDNPLDRIMEGGKSFIQSGQDKVEGNISGNDMKALLLNLFNMFFTIGVIIAVIVTSVIGVKFILASPSAKAEIKETLLPYVIGCVVIFGAYGIWKIVLIILQPLN